MKYVAVMNQKDGAVKIFVYNTEAKIVHTYWKDLKLAQEVAKDLNKQAELFKKRLESQR